MHIVKHRIQTNFIRILPTEKSIYQLHFFQFHKMGKTAYKQWTTLMK